MAKTSAKDKGNSNYARKRLYLFRLSKRLGERVFGFELTEKPWKRGR